MDKGIICRRDLIYINPLGGLEPWDRLGLGKTRGLGRFAATGAPWKWVLNLEGTRLAPILGIAGAAAGKKNQLYLPARKPDLETPGDDNHVQPQGLFFHGPFSEQRHVFTLFLSLECKQLPRPPSPATAAVSWCLWGREVQLQQLSKKATPKPFLLSQIPFRPNNPKETS